MDMTVLLQKKKMKEITFLQLMLSPSSAILKFTGLFLLGQACKVEGRGGEGFLVVNLSRKC